MNNARGRGASAREEERKREVLAAPRSGEEKTGVPAIGRQWARDATTNDADGPPGERDKGPAGVDDGGKGARLIDKTSEDYGYAGDSPVLPHPNLLGYLQIALQGVSRDGWRG